MSRRLGEATVPHPRGRADHCLSLTTPALYSTPLIPIAIAKHNHGGASCVASDTPSP